MRRLLGMRFKTPSLTHTCYLFLLRLPTKQVFSVLTYYAYLAWLIFALLLALLLYRAPPLGLLWLAVVVLRLVQFSRLGSRAPLPHGLHAPSPADEESGAAPLKTSASSSCCTASAVSNSSSSRVVSASPPPSSPRCVVDADAPTASASAAAAAERSALGRVLLVGNGPSIRDRGLGCVIDGFDTVVRFNSFVTKGLEEHTGSKTTLWCHMMQWYHISTVEIAQKAAWLPTCYAWNHVVLAPLIFVPNYLMPMLPPSTAITWSLKTYWRAHRTLGLRLHQVPTTGFVMLMRLLESTDRIHLIGFDGFGSGRELHYYKERKRQVRTRSRTRFSCLQKLTRACLPPLFQQIRVNAAGALLHDWAKEQAAIQRLIDEGRVVLL